MANRYLVISDLHLSDIEDHEDGWRSHKGSAYLFDEDLDRLVSGFAERIAGDDRLTLILGGDIIDFDLVTAVPEDPPFRVSRAERRRGLDATPAKSAWKLELVLSHHGAFVSLLARFIAAGHRVVYIMGNHDREMHFPEVKAVFVAALEAAARTLGLCLPEPSITFEPWFFYVQNEIYVEHGNQYDYYSSFRYLLCPTVRQGDEEHIALPMGNLSNRYLMSRMGYFNPHSGDFILNLFHYVFHWLQFYALSRRHIVLPWFLGSLVVVRQLLSMKKKLRVEPTEYRERLHHVAQTFKLRPEEIEALGQLQSTPITQRLFRILHEFWLDRLLIALLMTGGTIALALVNIPLWIKLMVPLSTFPLIYLIYEMFTRDESIFSIERELPQRARSVARVLPARLVVFGHTHLPRSVPLSRETLFVDTGAWAPMWPARHRGRLLSGMRNYLWATFQQGELTCHLGSWMDND